MIRAAFLIPGDLASPTGGYRYARELLAALPAEGVDVRHVALPGSWPRPTVEDRAATARMLAALPEGMPLLADGLAYGAFSEAEIAAARGPIVALVHHPLGYETGISAEDAATFVASEKAALARAAAVVVSSAETGRLLVEKFAVEEARIGVAVPGVAAAPLAAGSPPGGPLHLVALGAVSPRKAYDVLIDALSGLVGHDWRLTVAGSPAFDPATAADLHARVAARSLGDRITFAGALDDDAVAALLHSADLFVFPSHYEGYGMVLTEALACGLPVVATTGIPAALDHAPPAVRTVAPGDAAALAATLAPLLSDASVRKEAAAAARAAASDLPRWTDTAARVAAVLKRISA